MGGFCADFEIFWILGILGFLGAQGLVLPPSGAHFRPSSNSAGGAPAEHVKKKKNKHSSRIRLSNRGLKYQSLVLSKNGLKSIKIEKSAFLRPKITDRVVHDRKTDPKPTGIRRPHGERVNNRHLKKRNSPPNCFEEIFRKTPFLENRRVPIGPKKAR